MKIFHCRLSQDVNVSNALARRIIKYFRDDSSKADDFILKTFERGSRYGFGRLAQCYNFKHLLLDEWEKAAADRKMIDDVEASLFDTADATQPKPNKQPLIDAMKVFNAANIKEE